MALFENEAPVIRIPMSVDTPSTGWRKFIPLRKTAENPATPGVAVTLVDALGGDVETIVDFPVVIRGEGSGQLAARVTLDLVDGAPHILPSSGERDAIVNGAPLLASAALPNGETVTLQLEHRLCFLRVGAEADWPPGLDTKVWNVFETTTGRVLGQCPPNEIPDLLARLGASPAECAVCPHGLDTGFLAEGVAKALRGAGETAPPSAVLAGDEGSRFCPACWQRFDAGDALSIATHEELSGDPVLGPDHRLRFHPTRFNDAGIALDPMGLPAPDLACPHCRRRLPNGYLDSTHHILSIVGAPGSGKSYLLAVLTKVLHEGLFRDFGLTLRDDDPTGNLMLNQMRNRLFSAVTPEEAILSKTALEGAFYERLRRHGRTVALPRPFVYSIRKEGAPDNSFIFYDNAGEHFEPGLDPENSPGAMHVARSEGIFFLFDPTSNAAFRAELEGFSHDPQLTRNGVIDQQDTILAEMEVRIKRIAGLSRADRIKVPLAVLIGKCDVWEPVFNAVGLRSPVAQGRLNLARVKENSDYLRSLLLDLCPTLVSGAESISDNVRYFPVSALGHSPTQITEGPKAGMLAPNPSKLKPAGVNTAAYWLISQAVPGVIPTV